MDLHSISQLLLPVAHAAEETTKSSSPIGALGLDWHLFIAQLINFAVVMFILWKWVITPVAKKLTERTERIEKSLNDADRIGKEKLEFEQWRTAEISKTRTEAGAIINSAQTEAEKAKAETLQQTRDQQAHLLEQAKQQIEDEKNKALQSAKSELADLVTNAAEKILRQKLDIKKDAELIKDSLKQLT